MRARQRRRRDADVAVVVWAMVVGLGLVNASSLQRPETLIVWLGESAADAWAVVVVVSGLAALVGRTLALSRRHRAGAHRLEFYACVGVAATMGLYEAALLRSLGLTTLTTQILITGLAAAGATGALLARQRIRETTQGDPTDESG